ncbi:DUF2147 domain-containing protein [Roseivirga misakiensis]|uniref:DUF2147 domain-containing protein n=1 Tax=Roseivirga misakiensis TaxID=1563681 RepID=A0A1E5T102_9BACT|nr:DUF2147 domain-containing protein [Roseivirga misakiensis]OEK04987.1 hypothetical protein BFP71_16300 [Roseivirga misakiensis]
MKFKLVFLLLASLQINTLSANDGDEILGVWLTDKGRAKIEIYKENGKYNGKIIWLKEPKNERGEAKLDKENSDKSLRTRPIIGINLVQGFTFDGDDKWEGGEIYDPENGKTYSSYMRLKRGKLQVRGYLGITVFGRTVVWTREK